MLTAPSIRPLHVLLVEDDDDHAELTTLALEAHDERHRVTRARDGAEALDLLFQRGDYADADRPDLVLLDLNLPLVSGLEVLEHVKADEALRALPVVVLTTSDTETDRVRAGRHHANSYLVKPVDFAKFEAMIRELGDYWARWDRLPC
ncbi:MAG TPA: response regulator [Bacteroidetes bacterium]|nr:response regulator [Bacteroidota bacterium]HIL57412.1 response regulator [Rhodothermales bacterium]